MPGLKRVYVFDEVNLQVILDFTSKNPRAIYDWDEDISKLSLLISTTSSKVLESAGKPVFKFHKDIALIVGKYSVVAFFEDLRREDVKTLLSRIYKKLIKEKPVTANEIAEIVIEVVNKEN